MPTGNAGAAFVRALPATDFHTNDALFNQLTERNVVRLDQVSMPALGSPTTNVRIPNNGLLANLRLIFEGTLVVTTPSGSCTSGYGWPWNTLKTFAMSVNGQTQLKRAEGLDFRMRRNRVHRHPREEISSAVNTDTVGSVAQTAAVGNPRPGTIAAGSYAVTLEYDLPIVHDNESLLGLLYAQSDQNYLSFAISPGSAADMFTLTGGATVALSGTWYIASEYFDIPLAEDGKPVLPDLSWLHGILTSDVPYANTGTVATPFIRTDGSLLLFASYLDNGGQTQIAPTSLSAIRFMYGGNRRPREYTPTKHLLAKNQTDYNGLLQPNWIVIDNEVDNPLRDAVFPKGVSELKIEVDIPQGTTINPNARMHFLQESLFTGA